MTLVLFSGLITQSYETVGCNPRVIGYENQIANEGLLFSKPVMLLTTVLLSLLVLSANNRYKLFVNPIPAQIGKMSYSIFIWHQFVLAYIRHVYDIRMSVTLFLIYILIVSVLSWASYTYIEQRKFNTNKLLLTTGIVSLIITGLAFNSYLHAGVVRDVPELDITATDVHRGMHGEYCDRIYDLEKDFDDNDKIKVLCIGNSYARDMANILLESEYRDQICLRYLFDLKERDIYRIKQADVILIFYQKQTVPDLVWDNAKSSDNVWGIGTKHFGVCNGNIYRNRFSPDYHNQKAELYYRYRDINNQWAQEWGNRYINMIEACYDEAEGVTLFTEDGKLLSQDCYHLTPAGAKWFSKRINIKEILNIEE